MRSFSQWWRRGRMWAGAWWRRGRMRAGACWAEPGSPRRLSSRAGAGHSSAPAGLTRPSDIIWKIGSIDPCFFTQIKSWVSSTCSWPVTERDNPSHPSLLTSWGWRRCWVLSGKCWPPWSLGCWGCCRGSGGRGPPCYAWRPSCCRNTSDWTSRQSWGTCPEMKYLQHNTSQHVRVICINFVQLSFPKLLDHWMNDTGDKTGWIE